MVVCRHNLFTSLVEQRVTEPQNRKILRKCKGPLLLLHQWQRLFHLADL